MTTDECKLSTIQHIENVRKYTKMLTDKLTNRAINHDKSKLEEPELDLFTEYTPKLADTQYGTEEYQKCLEGLKPALDHHYAVNRHHPEHFKDGVNDMSLIDLCEMLADWKAATLRQKDGNLLKSIEYNCKRFNIGDQLKEILLNTASIVDEE
jgi:hypothetical protein